jgi:hypothetical protein
MLTNREKDIPQVKKACSTVPDYYSHIVNKAPISKPHQ